MGGGARLHPLTTEEEGLGGILEVGQNDLKQVPPPCTVTGRHSPRLCWVSTSVVSPGTVRNSDAPQFPERGRGYLEGVGLSSLEFGSPAGVLEREGAGGELVSH